MSDFGAELVTIADAYDLTESEAEMALLTKGSYKDDLKDMVKTHMKKHDAEPFNNRDFIVEDSQKAEPKGQYDITKATLDLNRTKFIDGKVIAKDDEGREWVLK